MQQILIRLASVLTLALVATSVMAATAADVIEVMDPYVRAVPPGQPNSASFMHLSNSSDQAHALVAVESPAAKVVELHTHIQDGDMMRMRPVEKIEIPAGGMAELAPGGHHVMMIGLHNQLTPNDKVKLTLVFEDGSRRELELPVRKIQMTMQHDKMQHKH